MFKDQQDMHFANMTGHVHETDGSIKIADEPRIVS